MNPQTFLDLHRPHLLYLIELATCASVEIHDIRVFLDCVDDDFQSLDSRPPEREPLPGEDVFWWCVDLIAQLGGVIGAEWQHLPTTQRLLRELDEMGGRLARGESLPATHQIEWSADEDEYVVRWSLIDDEDAAALARDFDASFRIKH